MGRSSTVLIMSLGWLIYGTVCFLGVSSGRCKYHGKPFEKEYKKARGTAYLAVGICWLAVSFLFSRLPMSDVVRPIILVVSALPGMIYSSKQEREFRKMDEELANEAAKIAEAAGEDGEE